MKEGPCLALKDWIETESRTRDGGGGYSRPGDVYKLGEGLKS